MGGVTSVPPTCGSTVTVAGTTVAGLKVEVVVLVEDVLDACRDDDTIDLLAFSVLDLLALEWVDEETLAVHELQRVPDEEIRGIDEHLAAVHRTRRKVVA